MTLLASSISVHADDRPIRVPPSSAYSWSGTYVGGYAGGAWATGSYSTSDAVCQFGGFFRPGGASGHNQPFFQGAGSFPAQYRLGASVIGGITSGFNWQLGMFV